MVIMKIGVFWKEINDSHLRLVEFELLILNQVWLLATEKINMRQGDVGRGKGFFNQNVSNLGRWWTQCSP